MAGGTKVAFLYGSGNETHQLGTRFFVHKGLISAV
jgi:hypothetical protein